MLNLNLANSLSDNSIEFHWPLHFTFYLAYFYLCECVPLCACAWGYPRGQKKVSEPLEVKMQSVLSHQEYVTKLVSSATIASTLNHLAISHSLCFTFGHVLSGSLSWLQAHYVSEGDFGILVFLLSSSCRDYRRAPSWLVYAVLGIGHKTLCMPSKYSISSTLAFLIIVV